MLVGPSGCGKSTILRMVAGLESITDGELYIDGKLSNNTPPKGRDIAMVFQNYALYPHMTVYQNLAFAMKLTKVSKQEIDMRVREVARVLEITELLKRKPYALSGGQRQRVAIGRAMVRTPKVFLMDEPLSNLDAKLRNQMRVEILKLRQHINTTFMYVTHDQTEAMTLGDRIVIMKDGCVQQIGTPEEVFRKPANAFVAGFIGTPTMNFFESCQLIHKGDDYYVGIQGVQFRLDEFQQDALKCNEPMPCDIIVGVRPQHISIGGNELCAVIDATEMLGTEIHVHAHGPDNSVVIAVPMTDLMKGVEAGQTIHFTFQPGMLHLFDKDTGNNLIWQGKDQLQPGG